MAQIMTQLLAYATIPSGEDSALCILCVDDIHKAKEVLDKGLQG